MTTVLQRASQNGHGGRSGESHGSHEPGARFRLKQQLFARGPAWPIVWTLALFPLWWVLALENHIFTIMAIPMIRIMYRWRATGSRKIQLPPGFGIWCLFLLIYVLGIATIGLPAPDTIATSVSNRVLSWTARGLDYAAVTVFLVYAGNLTERELPRRRLAWLLGLVGIYAVAGGLLGILDPHFAFTSPTAHLLPSSLQSALAPTLNPRASQNMGILGYSEARVSAPFAYTNTWGNCLAITLPWLVVAWWNYAKKPWQRRAVLVVGALALVPMVYSLDRGLWVGLGVGVVYLALRYAARGKIALLFGLFATIVLVAVVILASPLQSLISQRLAHGKSNAGRAQTSSVALQDGVASPILGFGDTRHQLGSTSSITIGKTASCSRCGNAVIGGDGQLQLLLVSNGFAGAIFYCGFFAYGLWRYRRDYTPYGLTAGLVFVLGFVFMFVYDAGGPPLGFTMLAYALVWKNDRELRHPTREPEPAERGPGRDVAWRKPGARALPA